MSSDCAYWTEKLDANVMMIIIHKLFRATAKFCICDRPLAADLRNVDMRNMQLTCRTWYARWRRFVVYIVLRGVPFCSYPYMCWQAYINASPRLPLFRRRTQMCDRGSLSRIYKNGRVLVIVKSAKADTPGEGTEN